MARKTNPITVGSLVRLAAAAHTTAHGQAFQHVYDKQYTKHWVGIVMEIRERTYYCNMRQPHNRYHVRWINSYAPEWTGRQLRQSWLDRNQIKHFKPLNSKEK